MDKIQNLRDLGELLKSGAISNDEFLKLKGEILKAKAQIEYSDNKRDDIKNLQKKNKIQPNDNIDEKIRIELLNYNKFFYLHCLPCGYNGPSGVVKRSDAWYFQWWFIFLSFFIFIGWLMLMWKGFMLATNSGRWLVKCPNCSREYLMDGRATGK